MENKRNRQYKDSAMFCGYAMIAGIFLIGSYIFLNLLKNWLT